MIGFEHVDLTLECIHLKRGAFTLRCLLLDQGHLLVQEVHLPTQVMLIVRKLAE